MPNGEIKKPTLAQMAAIREANLSFTRTILADPKARPEEVAAAKQTAIKNGGTDSIHG